MENHYFALLQDLSTLSELLWQIFAKSQNNIQAPDKFSRLIEMLNEIKWIPLHHTLKKPMTLAYLQEFIDCYCAEVTQNKW